ncbi:MAG: hypothetical protein SynsKO_40630 [Synoicihabitans sp.]
MNDAIVDGGIRVGGFSRMDFEEMKTRPKQSAPRVIKWVDAIKTARISPGTPNSPIRTPKSK